MKTDTPETDAESFNADAIAVNMPPPAHQFCHAALARRLERERDDLLSRLTAIELRMPEELARLEQERDEARRLAEKWLKIAQDCKWPKEALPWQLTSQSDQ